MADVETLGILEQIQALVSDKTQVVSYKWLSREFHISSNAAKRLLLDFVEKNGDGLEVIYSLSGWLKNNSSIYHVRLVTGSKLPEAKEDFNGNCSIQVYSVQASIPEDPAEIWNVEFIQAEELFKQPPAVVNCLRDNRFCGISNSFVKRNADGTSVSTPTPQANNVGARVPATTGFSDQISIISQPREQKVLQPTPKITPKVPDQSKEIQNGCHSTEGHEQGSKPGARKEQAPQLAASKKKGNNDKSSSGAGSSLASMWGRASSKPKQTSTAAEPAITVPISSEAQVCAHEAAEDGSSEDDEQEMSFKRTSNHEGSRKSRVVFDFSDDEDDNNDVVSLASPDPPKKQSPDIKHSSKSAVVEKKVLSFDEQKEDDPTVKMEKVADRDPKKLLGEESKVVSKSIKTEDTSLNKNGCPVPDSHTSAKTKATNAAPNSPKRRKVVKTYIDDCGREVTEVVWEGGEAETKPDSTAAKKGVDNAANNAVNRASATSKTSPAVNATSKTSPAVNATSKTSPAVNATSKTSPAVNATSKTSPAVNATSKKSPAVAPVPSGKAGNKKAGNKDPKQGNILSFFKKV